MKKEEELMRNKRTHKAFKQQKRNEVEERKKGEGRVRYQM
jgi:hypothetical protein